MITGTVSVHDYLRAQRLHRRSTARWSNLVAAALVAAGLVAWAWGGFSRPGMAMLCAGVGAFLGEWILAHLYLPRKVRRLHAQQKDLATSYTYSWDEGHIQAHSPLGSARRPWGHYVKFKEDDHVFLLYHADNLFEMIPKPWFSSPAQVDEFRRLALGAPTPPGPDGATASQGPNPAGTAGESAPHMQTPDMQPPDAQALDTKGPGTQTAGTQTPDRRSTEMRPPDTHTPDEACIVFVPPLVAVLLHAEKLKGDLLDEDEVLRICGDSVCVSVSLQVAAAMERSRGYADIDPENCWEEWQMVRLEMEE